MAATQAGPSDDLVETMPTNTAIDYELAGRLPSQTFRDLRSASKARRRHRTNLEKYYSYRGIHPGQVGQAHHDISSPQDSRRITYDVRVLPSDCEVVVWTKQDLYREAQCWPRPPTTHRTSAQWCRPGKAWKQSARNHSRRHLDDYAVQALRFDVDECSDSYFMSYVTGEGKENEVDPHVFRQCDYCWGELNGYYTDDEMWDCNGEPVGQLSEGWDVAVGDGGGGRFGFTGRAKVGAVFLMGKEDWRNWPVDSMFEDWGDEGEWWEDEAYREDDASDRSWDDVVSCVNEVEGLGAEWDVLSSCSSWSHVSR